MLARCRVLAYRKRYGDRIAIGEGMITTEELHLNWNRWIRLTHRWLSIAFTAVIIVNGVAVALHKYTNRLGLSAVFVLALEFFTGLYLFALPYAAKWRSGRARNEKG